jgi:outer membrane protein assembly factor BamB
MRRPLAILAVLLAATLRVHAQWPQFRGPEGSGSAGSAKLALQWGEDKNVRWKTLIHGRAWSSPVILNGQVWMTTATPDGRVLYAVSVDTETGRILKNIKVFNVNVPQYADPFNSYASPTPVIEPGRLYVTFGAAGTAAIDTATGKTVWERRDLKCNHFRGAGSSPILFENLLVMHFDGSDQQYVVALDKTTGKTVWKTNRSVDFQDLGADGEPEAEGDFRKGFATPQVVIVGGQPVIVSLGSKAAYAYDARTGKELWRIVDRSAHSPASRPLSAFGFVIYQSGWGGHVYAVRPDGRGDVTSTHVVWKSRGAPNKPSIVQAGDLLLMVNDGGIVTCLEAKTGEQVWKGRVDGEFSASPIVADGRVYLFSQDGKTTVIEAGRTFKVLAENLLDEGFMASPAVDGNALYLRTKTHLYRVDP